MIWLDYFLSFFQIHEHLSYLILFLGGYIDSIIGIGFFVYGEVFFLAGSILAGAGVLNIWFVSLACILGGILGDSTGYFLGKRYGAALTNRIFYRENKHLNPALYKRGQKLFHKYGLKSIFIGRFTGPISCVIPFLSGTLKVKYKDFLKYNIPASVVGISQFLILGYFFGLSYAIFLPKLERYILYMIAVVVAIMLYAIIRKLELIEKFYTSVVKRFF